MGQNLQLWALVKLLNCKLFFICCKSSLPSLQCPCHYTKEYEEAVFLDLGSHPQFTHLLIAQLSDSEDEEPELEVDYIVEGADDYEESSEEELPFVQLDFPIYSQVPYIYHEDLPVLQNYSVGELVQETEFRWSSR